jgi:hypothetical protein
MKSNLYSGPREIVLIDQQNSNSKVFIPAFTDFDASQMVPLDSRVLLGSSNNHRHMMSPRQRKRLKAEPFLSSASSSSCSEYNYTWLVERGQDLPRYPIGKTHNIDLAPKVVAANIAELFRRNSMYAVYNRDRDAEAICEMDPNCHFKVILYSASPSCSNSMETKENSGTTTIMEIMKTKGCSIAFFSIRCAIVKAARADYDDCNNDNKYDHYEWQDRRRKLPHVAVTTNHKIPVTGDADLYKKPTDEELLTLLEQIFDDLVQNDSYRQHSALELLLALTDVDSPNTCLRIVQMVLVDDEVGIRDICLNLFSVEATDAVTRRIKTSISSFFRNSLNILKNRYCDFGAILFLEDTDGDQNVANWYSDDLLPLIIAELNQSPCPHTCTTLIECLVVLFQLSPDLKEKARDMGIEDKIGQAIKIGQASHLKLYKLAHSAFKSLQSEEN